MALAPGTRLGVHEILGPIGAGGMGEVYRARDPRLGREVAIKVLPAAWAGDVDRLRRFEHEARAAAALNHPNILAVHDIGQEPSPDGSICHYIVSELLDGQTLRERLEPVAGHASLGARKTIEYGIQIALGLAAAHEKGIVHRDLKPENVFLTSDGRVKILDFGLAKLTEAESAIGGQSALPTEAAAARPQTAPGVVMGTAGYMAPEQVRGLSVDYRADIFALGAILYEMITGRRAFRGDTQMDTMLAILKEEPSSMSADGSSAAAPPALTRIIERCLEKSPAARFQSTRDLAFALEAMSTSTVTATTIPADISVPVGPAAPAGVSRWLYPVGAAFAAALITGIVAWSVRPTPPAPAVQRFVIPLPEGDAFAGVGRRFVAVSPDGAHIAYLANNEIYLRAIDQLAPQPIAGTTGARNPFFSPDGEWIGFWQTNQLKKIAITGGAPLVLCDAVNPFGASWERDGTILFGGGPEGISRVPEGGGAPSVVVTVDKEKGEVAYGPELLPDGQTILFTLATPVQGGGSAVAWDSAQIVVQAIGSDERRVVVQGGSEAHYLPSGHLAYERQGVLVAVPFDARRGVATGGPVPVIESVRSATTAVAGGVTAGNIGGTGAAQFAVSASGLLAYVEGAPTVSERRVLVWVDRQGNEAPVAGLAERAYVYPTISPDGQRVALDIRDQNQDIWVFDFGRQTLTKLTFDAAAEIGPRWHPDGHRLAYFRTGAGLFWQPADGTGSPEALTTAGSNIHAPETFTRDGRRLIFQEQTSDGTRAVRILTLDGKESAGLVPDQNSSNSSLSPDGRWLAYQAASGGPQNVYVRPFPDIDGGKWQVSRDGSTRPVWSRDGRELFFLSQPSQNAPVSVMAVPVDPTSTSTFAFRSATELFSGRYFTALVGVTYDVSPDGQRFLMIKDGTSTPDTPLPRIVVVDNWFEELKRRVPVN